jgi:hypothetical protein
MGAHVLPDSRAREPKGCRVVDWELPDGRTVRVEAEPVYCASCGCPFGWVPRENMAFCFWLCNQCFERYGAIAGTYAAPDEEFRRAVVAEVEARFGRGLTDTELGRLAGEGRLGRALELLSRESPYPGPDRRPRR